MLTSAGFSKDHRCLEGLFQLGARPHRGATGVSAAQRGNCCPGCQFLLVPSDELGPLQPPNEHSGVYSPSNKQTEEKPPRSDLGPDRPWLAVKGREECDPKSHGHGDISSLVHRAIIRAATGHWTEMMTFSPPNTFRDSSPPHPGLVLIQFSVTDLVPWVSSDWEPGLGASRRIPMLPTLDCTA